MVSMMRRYVGEGLVASQITGAMAGCRTEPGRIESCRQLLQHGPLDVAGVSRRHAKIHVSERGVMLEDLGSKNGTRVGEEPVNNAVALSDGDQIHVGPVMVISHASASGVSTETVVRK
jgi:pSer/pThr/pTyr-binding forkhead associated (FHA) protein